MSEGRPGLGAARGGETPTGAPTATPGRAHGFDSTPRRPPWHPGSFPRRTPSQRTAGPDRPPADAPPANRPTDRQGRRPLSLFPLHLAGRLSPRTQPPEDQARRAAAAAEAGTPFKPQLPPARRAALPPGTPRPPRGTCAPGYPPWGGARQHGRGVGQTSSKRDRTAGGRGGGANRQNEGRRRQGRPQRQPPTRGRRLTRDREAARAATGHASQTGENHTAPNPEQSRHARSTEPTRNQRTPPGARGDASRREREPKRTPTPTDEDPRVAACPYVRRRAGRGRPPVPPRRVRPRERGQPRGSRTLESPAEGEGGVVRLPRSPPAVGTLPWEGGGQGDNRTRPRALGTHHTRQDLAARVAGTWMRVGGTHTRRRARGKREGGWDREPTAALPNPPVPRRPLSVRGVPRTRACARPFPTTCHRKPISPTSSAERPVDRAPSRVIPPRTRSGEARVAVDERANAAHRRRSGRSAEGTIREKPLRDRKGPFRR